MELKEIQQTYQLLAQTIEILQKKLELSYFDALIETLGNLFERTINAQEALDETTVNELEKIYHQVDIQQFSSEEMRQIIQLLLLNSYKKEFIQPNHQMTPDSIGYLITFLIEKLSSKTKVNSILDITVGTGNLLSAILNNLKNAGLDQITAYGIDNDDTLLGIADISMMLQGNTSVELYHQDALDEMIIPQVDLVIGDLPVGYYPLDERAKKFKSHAQTGHSFAHYLLIERSFSQLKEGGWGIFIVPSGIFETKESQKLLAAIQDNGYLQGLLNLPQDLFVSEKSRKAIMLVQKKGINAKQAKQVLLGDFPSLKNKKAFDRFLDEISSWVKENLK